MKKIKIGQIGIGHNHGDGKMKAVRKFPELFEVVGFCETNPEWIKKRGDFECYRDLPNMPEAELISKSDAILVECDIRNLTRTAKRCVDAGKHVHIDKPASGTLEEYKALLDTAKTKNLTVQLGYMYRYNPAILKCMEMIKSGELGEIYQIDAEMSTYHLPEYRDWLKNFKGGSMYIFGSHLIDLIMLIMGAPNKTTSFIKQTGFEGIYSDDNCFAVMEYDKAVAKITNLSVEVNGWGMRRFAVMGSRGTVEIKPIEVEVAMTKSTIDKVKNHYSDIKETVDVSDVAQSVRYDEMMKEFYGCVTGKTKNPYSYEHEYAIQKVLYDIIGGHN